MKTSEEIKRTLRLCRMDEIECKQCAYEIDCKEGMGKQIDHDALELIETQEARITQLEKQLASQERDYAALLQECVDRGQKIRELEKQLAAAIGDMKRVSVEHSGELCAACANQMTDKEAEEFDAYEFDCYTCPRECACRECRKASGFAWRGVCKENGGAEE